MDKLATTANAAKAVQGQIVAAHRRGEKLSREGVDAALEALGGAQSFGVYIAELFKDTIGQRDESGQLIPGTTKHSSAIQYARLLANWAQASDEHEDIMSLMGVDEEELGERLVPLFMQLLETQPEFVDCVKEKLEDLGFAIVPKQEVLGGREVSH